MNDPQQQGVDTCGCCAGVAPSTPGALFNRAGLDAIGYRIGDYPQFNASLRAGLSSKDFLKLNDLRTRESDDYSIGLLDAVACVADVLTFYQERIANESYLRTATERVSLQEMGKLIGYTPRPGVAAATRLAFALEPQKTPPPGLPPDPGSFVTGIPAVLTLASGLKVQSVPGPGETPQTFETVEEILARPEWNAIRPWLSARRAPQPTDVEAWIVGTNTQLKVGDPLVIVDPVFFTNPAGAGNASWAFRRVDAVEPDVANDRTRVIWQGAIGVASSDSRPLQIHALRKRASVFGHNAPMWMSMSDKFRSTFSDGLNLDEWPDFSLCAAGLTGDHVDLDATYGGVKAGGLALVTRFGARAGTPGSNVPSKDFAEVNADLTIIAARPELFTELYRLDSATEVSRSAFTVSTTVTRIGVAGQNFASSFFNASEAVRETSAYVHSELLKLAPYPVDVAVDGTVLQLATSHEGLLAGRKLIVTGQRKDNTDKVIHAATLVDAKPDTNGAVLTITPPLPAILQRDTVVVFANVADATHGETVAQILGSGDASKRFQRFELKRLPLTYRSAPGESGVDSELSVRVGDIEWVERPTLFGAAPTDRVYTTSLDEQGRRWITFGDGVHGARPPSGINNMRAAYRQGLGAGGNVAADRLTQLLSRPPGLKGVSNPDSARGGADAESADQVRQTMPLGTRTLGRVVSLLDYEDYAMAFAGITKAQAQVLQIQGGPVIAITVAWQHGETLLPTDPAWNDLLQALKRNGDPHVRVVLLPCRVGSFAIGLKVKRDPAYASKPLLAAVDVALRTRYGFDARALGQPVLQSDVIATVHAVPGVLAVDLDFLYGSGAPPSRQTRLLASRMHVDAGVAIASELLTLDPGPLKRLEGMA